MFAPQRRRPAQPRTQTARIPAPSGMNTIATGSDMDGGDCIYLWNLIGSEYGLRARTGYREWCTGLTGAADNTVPTMMPFTGSAANGSKNKLFAITSTGIWDVSASSAAPSQVITFTTSANKAGRGVSHVVVTSGGHFMLYADEENGLFQYTESTNTWAQSAVTGITEGIANVCFVTVWKNRVFMVAKDTTKAYYLAAGAVTGAATAFDFATKFKAGGPLVGCWSWTYDGGAGIDDAFVGVSQGGDVAIYRGTDIADPTEFGLKGVWQLGAVPAGRRIASDTGGDLLLMSTLGAIPASKLVVGGASFSSQYATAKIANLFNSLSSLYRTVDGWGLYVHPADNALLVTVPTAGEQSATTQLAMSFASGGWGRYRDLPVVSGCVWDGDFYFGTHDGKVGRAVDYVDAVSLADPNSYSAVKYSALTRFHDLGQPRHKRLEMIKPIILSGQSAPLWEATARYDYNLLEPAEPSGTGSGGSDAWGEGLWDTAVWGADYVPQTSIRGATGMGRDVAIAMRGSATSRTVIVGWDVAFQQGGFL